MDEGKAQDLSRIRPPLFPTADISELRPHSLSLPFSLPAFCCFWWEICPLSGYHALSEHLPPSGPIFRKQMGSKAIPLPLQTAESGTLRSHLHTMALPETSHPWQGAHSMHTSHSRSETLLHLLTLFSRTCLQHSLFSLSLCCEGGWVTQCFALLHRGGGSALSSTASQGAGEEDSTRRMTQTDALQSNILAERQ